MQTGCDGDSPETSCSGDRQTCTVHTHTPRGTQGRRHQPAPVLGISSSSARDKEQPSERAAVAERVPLSEGMAGARGDGVGTGGIPHRAAKQRWGHKGRAAPPAGSHGTVLLSPAPRRARAGAAALGKANPCEVPAVVDFSTV